MDLKNEKYKSEFNPLGGWYENGKYTIKADNEFEKPIAVVLVGFGSKKAKEKAKEKADHIVRLLNLPLEIQKAKSEIEKDDRYQDKDADVFSNAPLALVQVALKNQMRQLKQVEKLIQKDQ